jgi:hypothetical protein
VYRVAREFGVGAILPKVILAGKVPVDTRAAYVSLVKKAVAAVRAARSV